MLKEFWDKKKHIIQLVGVMVAVGSIFLTIPAPAQEKSLRALANIQFVWLLIITGSVAALFIIFLDFFMDMERRIKEEHKIDITETLSLITITIAGYVIYNLWVYIINLYSNSAKDLIVTFNFIAGMVLGGVHFAVWRNLVERIPENPTYKRVIFSLCAHLLFAVILAAWTEFATHFSAFSFAGWIKKSSLYFLVLVAVAVILTLLDRRRSKKITTLN